MQRWEDLIGKALDSHAKPHGLSYTCILKKVMFGCFIMLFARKDKFEQASFRALKSVKIKTGTKGMTANKGAVAIRFNFEDTSFMFMNTHLTSGQKKVKERVADIRQTYTGATAFFDSTESQPVIPGVHTRFKRT